MDEELDDDISMVSMQVILNAGTGREKIDAATDAMADFRFDEAIQLLGEAKGHILEAHRAQTGLIQRQAGGERVEFSLLFVHAQDTLMTIDAQLHLTERLLPVMRALYELAAST